MWWWCRTNPKRVEDKLNWSAGKAGMIVAIFYFYSGLMMMMALFVAASRSFLASYENMLETVWGYRADPIVIASLFICISAHLRLSFVWNKSLVKRSIPLKLKPQPFLNNVNESCQSSPLWSATKIKGLEKTLKCWFGRWLPFAPLKIQLIQVLWESFEGCFRLPDCQRCQTQMWNSILTQLQQKVRLKDQNRC